MHARSQCFDSAKARPESAPQRAAAVIQYLIKLVSGHRLYTEAHEENLMRNWIWLVLALSPAFAQEKKAATLTAMDYIEIQQLVNAYGQDIDTCTNNGYDYADLYTPDGVFIDKYSDDGFKKGGVRR